MSLATLDLSKLAAPDIIETLSFEVILAALIADFRARDPSYIDIIESDPAYKLLEATAAREVILRQRINDATRAVMLAKAIGNDLNQLGGNYNTPRLTGETDSAYRKRIQLAYEALSTAGSQGSYIYHALSADPDVKDANAVLTSPGAVTVTILSHSSDGTAGAPLIATVNAALTPDDVRPLGDAVTVQSATITSYSVTAALEYGGDIVPEDILQAAITAVTDYTDGQHRLGASVAISGIYAALHRPGVTAATLTAPSADIDTTASGAPYCSAITITRATA